MAQIRRNYRTYIDYLMITASETINIGEDLLTALNFQDI